MKISVVIPAHNAAPFVEEAVASARRQTHAPCEVIVVDDGSSDETARVAERAGATVLRLERGGVSRARNAGARLASGNALLFLDADDVLLPHALEVLAGALSGSDAAVAYGMVIERAKPPKLARLNGFGFAAGAPPAPARANFWRCAVATPGSALMRAEVFREAGGFVTGYEPLEDRDVFMKIGMIAPVTFCDTVVLDKRWLPSSHGSQHAKRIWRGQRAQREFRRWCAAREMPTAWIPSDQEILRRALDEALWRRLPEIVPPLLRESRQAGVKHWKAWLYAFACRGPEPAWLAEGPKVLWE